MSTATLRINLTALADNWRALNRIACSETGAVVKADGYGLDAATVSKALASAGARKFFVAVAEEGAAVRKVLGPVPDIFVFSGHMNGDSAALQGANLIPLLNSPEQLQQHQAVLPNHRFGVQLDSGMNRLGIEPADWNGLCNSVLAQNPALLMSHLACADAPPHPMNVTQLQRFHEMTDGLQVPRSLAATGGILLGPEYHFDLTRPGIGLYGGAPFVDAYPVVSLAAPVIQVRDVAIGETVGYGNTWSATRASRIATVSAGYADGLIRTMGPLLALYADNTACPIVGRISMDLITVDVTDLPQIPEALDILNATQTVETLAAAAGTIGYEILTSLGARYNRAFDCQ